MSEDPNPYAPPGAVPSTTPGAPPGFWPQGRAVPLARGWMWTGEGFDVFRKWWATWLWMGLAFTVGVVVTSLVPVAGAFVVWLAFPVLVGGWMLAAADASRGLPPRMGHLVAGAREHFLPLAALGVVYLAGFFLFGCALVVVGLVFGRLGPVNAHHPLAIPIYGSVGLLCLLMQMAVWFAPALIVLRGASLFAALGGSFLGCARNLGPLLVHGLIATTLYLVAALPCGLGMVVYVPVMFLAIHRSYREVYFDDPASE